MNDEDKIKQRIERKRQEKNAIDRALQRLGADLSKVARNADTRRKILKGGWLETRAEAMYPGITARMLADLAAVYLVHDKDRALFTLPPLPDDERERRLLSMAEARKRKAKPKHDKPQGGNVKEE